MAEDFDLESLVYLEQTFFDTGHAEGYAHGRIHGLIEGRALGREKGFEMWEELGFYEGFARGWRAILQSRTFNGSENSSERAMQHIRHLLDLINQFPQVNPSNATSTSQEIDISKLQRQIRSRYKALCSCLGVRPRMQPASGPTSSPLLDGDAVLPDSSMEAEPSDTNHDTRSSASIRLPDRVAPGSAIPVWKIDKKSGLKSAVTNMDLSF